MADLEKKTNECAVLVKKFAAERTKENMIALMTTLENAVVFVPIATTTDMPAEVLEEAKKGGKVMLPKGTKVQTKLLKASDGSMIFPVFTSADEMQHEGINKQIMLMPFVECARVVVKDPEKIKALVVNPFTDNVGIVEPLLKAAIDRKEAFQKAKAAAEANGGEVKEIKVTEKQFHQLNRSRVEYAILPQRLFAEKDAFLEEIYQKKGDFFFENYKKGYGEKVPCPYTEEQFSVMILNMRANFQMICVDLPNEKLQVGMCYKLYMTWNQDTDEFHYFTIERGKDGRKLGEVNEERKHQIIGDAPAEGSEMNTIMDYLGIE